MLVTLDNVTKRYLRGPREIVALDRVTLDVESGERLGVLGTARAGKSTLLRLAAGLEPPDAGTVALDGRDIATLSRREHAKLLRHEIGCVWDASGRGDAEALHYVAWPLLSAGVPVVFSSVSVMCCLTSVPRCLHLAGQEGIEPPTPGFGDRCSAN